MDPTRAEEGRAPPPPPAGVPDPPVPIPLLWLQAHECLREIEAGLGLVPENGRDGEGPLRLLVGRMAATLQALRQADQETGRRAAERTAALSEANAVLQTQSSDIAQAERRLDAEHAVARALAASSTLADAAPTILRNISQSLGWDVGTLWVLDRDAEVLRCVEVWSAPAVAIPVFEQASRQMTFAPGVGLPGRVWASDRPVWVPDVTQDASCPRAPIAMREGLHATVGFPIRNGTEFLGVMEFYSLEIREPDEELLRMMTSIGSHLSQFMERLRAERALFLNEAQLCVARKIQQALVARAPPALAGFEIAGACHCAVETGGDYFDFFSLLGSCQGIVIADASGHGLGAALLATATRAYLRALAPTNEDIGRIMALANDRLAEDVADDCFVTLFLARLDPRTRSLLYASAGHPSGCQFDASGTVKALLGSTGPPLGVVPDADFPTAPAVALETGDLVLFLTDGVVEARAPDGTAFGFQRAADIVRVYRSDPAARIVDNLYHAVRAFTHNYPQVDDITAVVIKVREAS